jgi:hypothetical protein
MKKHGLIISFFLIFAVSVSYSQNTANFFSMSENISILENRINKLLKKHHSLSKIHGLQQFHIFWMGHNYDFRKEDYSDHSFLYKLVPSYIEKSKGILKHKKYLRAETLICDSTGKLVAMGNDRFVTLVTLSKYRVELAKILHDKKMDFIFYMGHKLGMFIGVKDQDVYVIIESSEKAKIYSLKEFINCCYDDLEFPASFTKR